MTGAAFNRLLAGCKMPKIVGVASVGSIMSMKTAFLITLLGLACYAQAQDSTFFKKRVLVGSEVGIALLAVTDPATGDVLRQRVFRFGPQLGAFITPRLAIGVSGEYEWHVSDFEPTHPTLYGAGGFMRYYITINALEKALGGDRMLSYVGASYHRTNHYPSQGGEWEVSDRFSEHLIFLSIGINLRLIQQLHLELSAKPEYYLGQRGRFSGRAGFEYHIRSKLRQ
jgi:hypothetical protein